MLEQEHSKELVQEHSKVLEQVHSKELEQVHSKVLVQEHSKFAGLVHSKELVREQGSKPLVLGSNSLYGRTTLHVVHNEQVLVHNEQVQVHNNVAFSTMGQLRLQNWPSTTC